MSDYVLFCNNAICPQILILILKAVKLKHCKNRDLSEKKWVSLMPKRVPNTLELSLNVKEPAQISILLKFFVLWECAADRSDSVLHFNSRTAIAGAIIGLLLVFTTRRGVLIFLRIFFYRKYYSFRRFFDLKAKVSKIAVWTNFFWAREVFWSCAAFSEWIFDFEK